MSKNKCMPILWLLILVVLFVNMSVAVYEFIDYKKRVESGNDRWEQVEGKIEALEDLCYGKYDK